MNLKITFHGKIRSRDSLIRGLQRIVQQQGGQLVGWQGGLRAVLCPMGYLDVNWEKGGGLFGGWKITGSCVTTPGGPGLHKAAVEIAETLGQKELKEFQLEDGTGYPEHRDFTRLTREVYEPWLEQALHGAVERLNQSDKSVPLFWGEERYLPQEVPGTVYTPVGRFSKAWIQERLEQGRIRELAQRIFLWPNPSMDARYYRNGSLKRMWQDCCFAPSERSTEDEQINGFILNFLERAAGMDPTLPLPLAAYRELCIMADRDFKIPEEAPELEEEYIPGYHKGELLQSYGKLWFPLPGICRREWENDGKGGADCIWKDEDGGGPVWKLSCQKGKAGLEQCRDVETLALEEGSLSWGWRDNPDGEEDDRPCQVVGEAHVGEEHYFLTVDCADGEERAEVYSRLRRAQSGPKMTGEWE